MSYISYIPDNYDAYKSYENEIERQKRLHKRRSVKCFDSDELPFYPNNEDDNGKEV